MKRIIYTISSVCLLITIAALNNNCKKEKEERNLPVLITVPASIVTATTALLGGQIAYDGGAEITDRGVCCATSPDPEISDLRKTGGIGIGSFTCAFTRLIPKTLYYARAYATNSKGTAYGGEVRFTTSWAEAPAVITLESVSVSFFDACMGGRVIYNGDAAITEKGICWSATKNPTLDDNKSFVSKNIDNYSAYTCCLDSLEPSSVYYARAYAINAIDTAYGEIISITTLAIPEIKTVAATEIAATSALVSGNAVSFGDAFKIEIGICYGTRINPTYYNSLIKTDTVRTGEYKCLLTKLNPGTLYHVRAYVGWGMDELWGPTWVVYGNEITFTTKDL